AAASARLREGVAAPEHERQRRGQPEGSRESHVVPFMARGFEVLVGMVRAAPCGDLKRMQEFHKPGPFMCFGPDLASSLQIRFRVGGKDSPRRNECGRGSCWSRTTRSSGPRSSGT